MSIITDTYNLPDASTLPPGWSIASVHGTTVELHGPDHDTTGVGGRNHHVLLGITNLTRELESYLPARGYPFPFVAQEQLL